MICSVIKRKRRDGGETVESRHWFGKLRMPWEQGPPRVWCLNTPDKREAVRLLMEARVVAEKRHHGLLPPQETADARTTPLPALLEAFLTDRREHDRAHTTLLKYRNLHVLFRRCGWAKLDDVTQRSFLEWRKGSPLSRRSKNDLLRNTRTFFHWLRRRRMAVSDPLELVDLLPVVRDGRFRRAVSPAEMCRLTTSSPPLRAAIYLLAASTGLRRTEIRSLLVGDFVFETPSPFVRVRASIAKNRKEAELPLRAEVVDAVRVVIAPDALPFERAFPGGVPRLSTFRRDLARAEIPFETPEGRFDFHSLRVTFGTSLLAQGVPAPLVMKLVRHSDIRLTMKFYVDPARLPLAAAVASLPAFTTVGQATAIASR